MMTRNPSPYPSTTLESPSSTYPVEATAKEDKYERMETLFRKTQRKNPPALRREAERKRVAWSLP